MHPHDDDRGDELPELRSLPSETPPPASLEGRTLQVLRERGLVSSARGGTWLRIAAVLALMAGAAAGGWVARGSRAALPDRGPRFVLLLYGEAAGHGSMDDAVAEYGRWARGLAGSGTGVSGERLANQAVVVGRPIDAALVRGYFIVHASDERRAVEIAQTHPHVKRGGTIIVRRIAPT